MFQVKKGNLNCASFLRYAKKEVLYTHIYNKSSVLQYIIYNNI